MGYFSHNKVNIAYNHQKWAERANNILHSVHQFLKMLSPCEYAFVSVLFTHDIELG